MNLLLLRSSSLKRTSCSFLSKSLSGNGFLISPSIALHYSTITPEKNNTLKAAEEHVNEINEINQKHKENHASEIKNQNSNSAPSKIQPISHKQTRLIVEKQIKFKETALRSPLLITLHRRLELPKSFELYSLARCLTCKGRTSQYSKNADNSALAYFGESLLDYYVTEHLITKYPRLPLKILENAVDAYTSDKVLHDVAANSWGIEADNSLPIDLALRDVDSSYYLGKLRYVERHKQLENDSNFIQIDTKKNSTTERNAMASAVKSILAVYYASTESLSETKKFIHAHILSRKLDVSSLFAFNQPTRELSVLCKRENLEPPVTRLISETGRLSRSPVFVAGVFSGTEKLGESYASSLQEAKIRAAVAALKNYYLYSPLNPKYPSDEDFSPALIVDHGDVIV
ncbi:mitochondrial 54S ribosomal protein mL44 ASCRUDRAFT_74759 [Ascoidea rubescens DSM 1968]|uniref:Large ribosomal subunit protein mL44 n=1 Tax=Ascoidea rubescens DSM 1968 TaxID=1344418 RepID=A0A1D2VL67_9ASCO|nr:hypothetical protein ASCRUDRAFT_74759 [Ascoidea rubescens DSM 1968]ODV62366.1 hypothetical protein ASCRUDRAFT_74759 [Ascoidea rubescens DSM 1968]